MRDVQKGRLRGPNWELTILTGYRCEALAHIVQHRCGRRGMLLGLGNDDFVLNLLNGELVQRAFDGGLAGCKAGNPYN